MRRDASLCPQQAANCPVALMPLSYNWDDLKDKIDAMQPTGNTNTTIGLERGWHSLTPGRAAECAGGRPQISVQEDHHLPD